MKLRHSEGECLGFNQLLKSPGVYTYLETEAFKITRNKQLYALLTIHQSSLHEDSPLASSTFWNNQLFTYSHFN